MDWNNELKWIEMKWISHGPPFWSFFCLEQNCWAHQVSPSSRERKFAAYSSAPRHPLPLGWAVFLSTCPERLEVHLNTRVPMAFFVRKCGTKRTHQPSLCPEYVVLCSPSNSRGSQLSSFGFRISIRCAKISWSIDVDCRFRDSIIDWGYHGLSHMFGQTMTTQFKSRAFGAIER